MKRGDQQEQERKSRRLVLLGGGHSHIEVLRRFAMRPDPTTELVLVSPSSQSLYSGMLPGYVAGQYQAAEIFVDVAALATRSGAIFLRDTALRVQAAEKKVELAERPPLAYDLLSLDIGSATALPPLDEEAQRSNQLLATRPFALFFERLPLWDKKFAATPRARLLVLGSGAAGFELACAFRGRYRDAEILLLASEQSLAPLQERALAQRGIQLRGFGRALAIQRTQGNFRVCGERGEVEGDFLVCATGAQANPLVVNSGLPEKNGYLTVNATLQCPLFPEIFGAGDSVSVQQLGRPPLPKAGVYAVRAAPVLAHNLLAYLQERPLEKYRAQRRFLQLLNLGDGHALARYGAFLLGGAWAWRWKDAIDRRFVEKYMPAAQEPMAEPDCGGCGSKAAADVVCALRAGVAPTSKKTVWGVETAEDIALWESSGGAKIAITVDQFRNFGADPYLFGRIAAVSAASDLYAKGIRPEAALLTLTLPKLSGGLGRSWAEQLSAGLRSVLGPEGVDLLGGHTSEGDEWAMGFTLWASTTEAPWPKRGVRLGDSLLLTKPLGTGILLTAAMQGVALGDTLETAFSSMAQSQRLACDALQSFAPHASTDVTGFSLLGHLSEMLEGSDAFAAELSLAKIPLLEGSQKLFMRGYRSRMQALNQRSFPVRGLSPEAEILYDPQTSGGLLVSLAAAQAPAALAALRSQGVMAAEIGRIVARAPGSEKIRVCT